MDPRPIAAVRERMTFADVPARFVASLEQIYAAARDRAIAIDGQSVFVYRAHSSSVVDVEFGVGARSHFTPVDGVVLSHTPAGDAVTTTHWGEYDDLGRAHEAVVAWCAAHGHQLSGTAWEVYGHWHHDPSKRRTDVYHLLRPASNESDGTV